MLAIGVAAPACGQTVPASSPTESITTAVVVTARKIEERVQDIPMSVNVLSGDLIDESRTTRLHELQFAVPGLVVNTTGLFGASFSLRGITDQRVGGLSVAPHLDGVYLGDANVAIGRLFDLERVEVLKGPQGTLYGRNSTAGSLNFVTRAPQQTLGSEVEVSYGSFETTRAQGHVNIPGRYVDMRVAFVASEGDGYIRNTADKRRFGEDDYWGVRGSLRLDMSDDWHLDIMAQHVRDDGGTGDLWTPSIEFLVDPDDIRLTTVTIDNPYLISKVDNLSLNFEYELGFATFRSISGYVQSDVRNVDDCAGSPVLANCVRSAQPNEFDQWSQELQLVFPRSGSVDGIVGAYFSEADAKLAFYQLLPVINAQPLSDNLSTRDESTAALFGQATLHFTDRWSGTAGLRLSREKQHVTNIGSGVLDSPAPLVEELESNETSWLLNVSYAIGDDAMLYVSASNGYKSGGVVTTTLQNGLPDRYGPEYVTAFEAGGKSVWLSGRLTLNAAAFFYDYEDLQVSTAIVSNGEPVFGVDNAAKARLYGVDATTSYELAERWSISGGVVWLPEREFVEYLNEQTGDTLSGNTLVRAPEWSTQAAIDYAHPVGELGTVSARIEYNFRSGYYYTPENVPQYYQESFGLLNAYLRFEAASEAWYVFASGRNLTSENYFTQVFLQSSPGYPDTYEIGAGYRF